MQIRNRLLRELAERGIISWKSDYYNDSEREFLTWIESEKTKLETGEDIEPPWIQFNGIPPWHGAWRQGNGHFWLKEIWSAFWERLTKEEKRQYLERWQPPDEEWREYITLHWWSDNSSESND